MTDKINSNSVEDGRGDSRCSAPTCSETGDYRSFRDAILLQKEHFLFLAQVCDEILETAPKDKTMGLYSEMYKIPR